MATTVKRRKKKKVRIRYGNLALVLAGLLMIVLFLVWIFSPKDKPNDTPKDPASTGDGQYDDIADLPPEDETPGGMTTDPTLQTSYVFTSVSVTESDLGIGPLALVNNNIEYRGHVSESDLVVVREGKNSAYKIKDYSVLVRKETLDNLNNMMLDFFTVKQNDDVMVISGHRTVEYQAELYQDELEETGLETSSLVSRPGYSEHHTGYVIDFKIYDDDGKSYEFDGTGDCEWIMQNCHKYGFINRYPLGKEKITLIDNEPWHFRYVGKVHAGIITEYDFCMEEYIEFLKNYTTETGFLKAETDDGKTYIIYYVPMVDPEHTTVFLPIIGDGTVDKTPYPYEISGNNIDGWIVTVDITAFGSDVVELNPTPAVTEATEAEENTEE